MMMTMMIYHFLRLNETDQSTTDVLNIIMSAFFRTEYVTAKKRKCTRSLYMNDNLQIAVRSGV